MSKVVYTATKDKVIIVCAEHGDVEVAAHHLLAGAGCGRCGRLHHRLTTEQFVERAVARHGDRFDYSESVYTSSTAKLTVICRKHGPLLVQPDVHVGRAGRGGCFACNSSDRRAGRVAKTDEFVEVVKAVHGDRYDLSKVVFTGMKDRVIVVCAAHGEFSIRAEKLKAGGGCGHCARLDSRLTTEQFVERAVARFGDRYDYSESVYTTTRSKLTVVCREHGPFMITPNQHLNPSSGGGCRLCALRVQRSAMLSSTVEFIEKAKAVHGDRYDYSLVDYVSADAKVTIICRDHGPFQQVPSNHLMARNCLRCRSEGVNAAFKSTSAEFAAKASVVHGDRYDYSLVDYVNVNVKVAVICVKHGEFLIRPDHHLGGAGCRACRKSRGEEVIAAILNRAGLRYETEKSFDDLKGVGHWKLRFDLFIPATGVLIEFDGAQHFQPIHKWGGVEGLERLQANDRLKDEWVAGSGFRLVRVRFDEDPLAVLVAAGVVSAAVDAD